MLLGALPFGVGFFLMFSPPPFEGDVAAALYYAVVFILYDTAFTIVNAPYAALTAELTEDYDERASLAGWRMGNSILCCSADGWAVQVAGGGSLRQLVQRAEALRNGYAVAGALWGLIIVASPLLVVAFIREPERGTAEGGRQARLHPHHQGGVRQPAFPHRGRDLRVGVQRR